MPLIALSAEDGRSHALQREVLVILSYNVNEVSLILSYNEGNSSVITPPLVHTSVHKING